jgi:hypothetical protein
VDPARHLAQLLEHAREPDGDAFQLLAGLAEFTG